MVTYLKTWKYRRGLSMEGNKATHLICTMQPPTLLARSCEAMRDKRQTLAMLGAAMLQDLAIQETAEAAGIKAAARMAVLRLVVNAAEEAMNKAAAFMAERHGEARQLDVKLNREFVSPRIDPAILQVYLTMIRENRISYETFYALLTDADLDAPGDDRRRRAAGDSDGARAASAAAYTTSARRE